MQPGSAFGRILPRAPHSDFAAPWQAITHLGVRLPIDLQDPRTELHTFAPLDRAFYLLL